MTHNVETSDDDLRQNKSAGSYYQHTVTTPGMTPNTTNGTIPGATPARPPVRPTRVPTPTAHLLASISGDVFPEHLIPPLCERGLQGRVSSRWRRARHEDLETYCGYFVWVRDPASPSGGEDTDPARSGGTQWQLYSPRSRVRCPYYSGVEAPRSGAAPLQWPLVKEPPAPGSLHTQLLPKQELHTPS